MIIWTDYLKYRAQLRGFDLGKVEEILRYSLERYEDRATGRRVVVGRHGETLVLVPCEVEADDMTPITIHRTTRQQITSRLNSGRYRHV